MTNKRTPPRGFDTLPYVQTTYRDCILRKRIPHLLESADYIVSTDFRTQTADYIYELEEALLQVYKKQGTPLA